MDEVSIGSPEAGDSQPGEKITLSDVIAAIQTELSTSPTDISPPGLATAGTAKGAIRRTAAADMNKPYVRIAEQPASKALRFRYQCEGRSAGSIPGANSTSEVKTYPAIQICGYTGRAVVLVSCVTKDPPYRPHPHNLVGREGCKKGVCTLEIPSDTMSMTFSNLGIQCVKKRDIAENLDERKANKVDPFNTGFAHKSQPTSIDLNAVRLCFQVYIPDVVNGGSKYSIPLDPVVSDPIYDKKAMCDLTIVKLSHCASSVDGGKDDIILLCEKVTKEDIEVRFFEEVDGQIAWEAKGEFQPSQVHKQTAIWFRAPRYKSNDIIEPVTVNIQLRRPSDGACSEPLPFLMLPKDSGFKRKRKLESESNIDLLRPLRAQEQVANRPYNTINNRQLDIKEEPREAQPYVSPIYQQHSPTYAASISPNHFPPGPSAPNAASPYYLQPNELLPPEPQWNVPLQMPPPQAMPHQFVVPTVEPVSAVPGSDAAMNVDSSDLMQQVLGPEMMELYKEDQLSDSFSRNLSFNDNNVLDSLSREASQRYEQEYATFNNL